jgi:hypothetical protein
VPSFRTGTVTAVLSERAGLQRVEVDGEKAYVLTQLIGTVAVGDEVVINTTAVELGLGTGGSHVVHWNLARREWSQPGPGHVMKLRYSSLQADTGVAEEETEPAAALEGKPVVACALHSQVAVVARAVRALAPDLRITYVMTDSAALPLAFSDLVPELPLHETITAGQAFGGDKEAVNVWSALALSTGDVVIAGAGPGVVGTGTRLGASTLEVAHIVDATAALGGTPIVAARHSDADQRDRHRGRSHHTTTALELAHVEPLVPEPAADDPDVDLSGITTMGRGSDDDPAFFAWTAAAGFAAARLALASRK